MSSEEDKTIEPAGKVIGIAIRLLLGNNEKERNEIKKSLIKAYEIRNAKIHGNLKKLEKYRQDVNKVSIDVEDYLRHAPRRFIEE